VRAQGYTYNATDSSLAAWSRHFTSRIGDGTGNHEEEYHSRIKLIVDCKPNAKFLDVGCGLGRIVEMVRPGVGILIGLEPDVKRFQACHTAYDDGDRIRILNATTLEYKEAHRDDRFDIVAVSMVLQHVSTSGCNQILRDVHDLLTPDGVAIIATTQKKVERFTYQTDPTPHTVEEFDLYAEDTGNQRFGIPVRMFSKASFIQAIDQVGLHILNWGQMSYIRPESLWWFATKYGVSPDELQDVGISQYAVVKIDRS
jgi:SAM-dependent methyltransferase